MAISTQKFATIVSNAVAAVQGAASVLVDFTVGSISLSYMQAVGAMALWLQGIALQVASLTRFATSVGTDADTWGYDYDFIRLPAQSATGQVTFSRFTATAAALIPIGFTVQSADGTQSYTVIADTSQAAYSPTLLSYVIPVNTSSIAATVSAVVGGTAGNVGVGIISVLGASIAGVDTVTNASGFTNGANAESDTAFKARFVLYINALAKATLSAVESAIASVQQNIYFSVTENQDYNGTTDNGFFYVVVDDGTGAPSGGFLSTVSNAVDAVRAIGSRFAVYGPSLITANVSMTVTVQSGYSHSVIAPIVQSALTAYINQLELGQTLPYTRLAQVAYDSTAGITDVTVMLLNSATADVTATPKQVIRAGTVVIS